MDKIGTIIRRHRIEKGLTQEELGSKVFVSKQAVSKWETGRTLPDLEMIRKLCDILEINKDEILGGSIEQTKKNRKWLNSCVVISIISIYIALFFALGGAELIDRHTQSGVTYVSVFWNDELLSSDQYQILSDLNFKEQQNGYKASTGYGEIRGILSYLETYSVEFGFINTNNWHNVHICIYIEEENGFLSAKQTVNYETDGNVYEVITTQGATSGKEVSLFREGV